MESTVREPKQKQWFYKQFGKIKKLERTFCIMGHQVNIRCEILRS
uniref:Unclassified n=3 Tax=Fusarium pseudograminearum TaxID=101028 RepID=W1I8W3_FUSPS|nr:unclassified [Fusarium pseudograminearum CS3220]CDL73082.1 unclassified [Fusarium pseudograminearum CS3427]CDL73260.1 unclassified [Fusarium pseudograminearum CS3487]CDX48386.1 unclassified [Fusarium pseudograminearum CS3487]CDX48388.1 unclassified [Fusarium pseudograminearum CS3427]